MRASSRARLRISSVIVYSRVSSSPVTPIRAYPSGAPGCATSSVAVERCIPGSDSAIVTEPASKVQTSTAARRPRRFHTASATSIVDPPRVGPIIWVRPDSGISSSRHHDDVARAQEEVVLFTVRPDALAVVEGDPGGCRALRAEDRHARSGGELGEATGG